MDFLAIIAVIGVVISVAALACALAALRKDELSDTFEGRVLQDAREQQKRKEERRRKEERVLQLLIEKLEADKGRSQVNTKNAHTKNK